MSPEKSSTDKRAQDIWNIVRLKDSNISNVFPEWNAKGSISPNDLLNLQERLLQSLVDCQVISPEDLNAYLYNDGVVKGESQSNTDIKNMEIFKRNGEVVPDLFSNKSDIAVNIANLQERDFVNLQNGIINSIKNVLESQEQQDQNQARAQDVWNLVRLRDRNVIEAFNQLGEGGKISPNDILELQEKLFQALVDCQVISPEVLNTYFYNDGVVKGEPQSNTDIKNMEIFKRNGEVVQDLFGDNDKKHIGVNIANLQERDFVNLQNGIINSISRGLGALPAEELQKEKEVAQATIEQKATLKALAEEASEKVADRETNTEAPKKKKEVTQKVAPEVELDLSKIDEAILKYFSIQGYNELEKKGSVTPNQMLDLYKKIFDGLDSYGLVVGEDAYITSGKFEFVDGYFKQDGKRESLAMQDIKQMDMFKKDGKEDPDLFTKKANHKFKLPSGNSLKFKDQVWHLISNGFTAIGKHSLSMKAYNKISPEGRAIISENALKRRNTIGRLASGVKAVVKEVKKSQAKAAEVKNSASKKQVKSVDKPIQRI